MRYRMFGTHKGLRVYEFAGLQNLLLNPLPNPLPNPLSNVHARRLETPMSRPEHER
jgi:hypothetical protein